MPRNDDPSAKGSDSHLGHADLASTPPNPSHASPSSDRSPPSGSKRNSEPSEFDDPRGPRGGEARHERLLGRVFRIRDSQPGTPPSVPLGERRHIIDPFD